MLKRLFDYFDRNEKGLYWVFWFLIASPIIRRIFQHYWGKPSELPSEGIVTRLYMLLVLIWSIGGRYFWRFLKKEEFKLAKNALVSFGGFFSLHFVYFIPLICFGIFSALFDIRIPELFSMIAMLSTVFVCGCWMGHRFDRLIWFWCALAVLISWLTIGHTIIDETPDGVMDNVAQVIVTIVGAYFWHSRLIEEKDAASIPQQAQPFVEDKASIHE